MLPDVEKYIPGQSPVLAKDMNTLGQAVAIINNISGPDVVVDSTGVHFRRPIILETVVARLTASEGDGLYDWTEVAPYEDGTFDVLDGGKTSDDSGLAVAPDGSDSLNADATTGAIVTLRRRYDPDTGSPLWVIISAGGTIDVYNNTSLVAADAKLLSVASTNGTTNVFQAAATSVGGTSGAGLSFKTTGASDYMVLGVFGGNVVWDWPRVNNT